MTTEKFNLIDEAWLPVLMKDGSCRRVSLREVFDEKSDVADLSLVAYERISVMRFLICLALAAFEEGELKDEAAWKAAREKLGSRVNAYLDKWHDRFNFFGDHAFMQPDGLTPNTEPSVLKVMLHRASGSNGTLFDHKALLEDQEVCREDLPVAMLTFLNYAACCTLSQCAWDGVLSDKSVKNCPSRESRMLQCFLRGDNVQTTIWLNLLTTSMVSKLPTGLGRPVWEKNLSRSDLKGVERLLLPRLVPLSRVMKFSKDSSKMILGEGLKYGAHKLPEFREPFAVVVTNGKDNEPHYLEADVACLPWRSLMSILTRTKDCCPLCFGHLNSVECLGDVVSIWCGGLDCDTGKDKSRAPVEWFFTFSAEMLKESFLISYQNCVLDAETMCSRLDFATRTYCAGVNPKEEEKIKKTDKEWKHYKEIARTFYWICLSEQKYQMLLLDVAGEKCLRQEWRVRILDVAQRAYDHACPHATGRQLEAFAKGLAKLYFKKEN